MNSAQQNDLEDLARRIRLHVLHMTSKGESAHIGSCFSIVDILSVLYGSIMKYDPQNPRWEGRDRFILSKGHAAAALYSTLVEVGFADKEILATHYQDGSQLCGHVSHEAIPGIEFSTGSLGHGLSVSLGMSYAAKKRSQKHQVFVLASDGELDEGSMWEAILFAAHHRLDNLVLIIDYNKLQSLDTVDHTLQLEPLIDKFKAFNWSVCEVDGHSHEDLKKLFQTLPFQPGKPSCVLAHTVKGKGVSFMEGKVLWHYRTAKGEEFEQALKELSRGS